MPTVGINSTITLSIKEARSTLFSFYKALSVESVTTRILVLAAGTDGTLTLSDKELIILICNNDVMKLEITDKSLAPQTIVLDECGFWMAATNDLSSVKITNTSTEEQEINVIC